MASLTEAPEGVLAAAIYEALRVMCDEGDVVRGHPQQGETLIDGEFDLRELSRRLLDESSVIACFR